MASPKTSSTSCCRPSRRRFRAPLRSGPKTHGWRRSSAASASRAPIGPLSSPLPRPECIEPCNDNKRGRWIMRRWLGFLPLALVLTLPWMSAGEQVAEAGGYYRPYCSTCYYTPSYSYYRPSYYTPSYSYFNYYPTLPTYQSYYQPTYSTYYATNYYDGGYHYHEAGYWRGSYYPAGYYRWTNGYWQGQQGYAYAAQGDWKSQDPKNVG